jgi:NAD-dependent dihydropyrimidine dehydrogenase PreA subunit
MIQEFINVSTVSNYLLLNSFTLMLVGHVSFGGDKLVPIGRIHYVLHWLYGKYEPWILRLVDWLLSKKILTDSQPGRALLTLVATTSYYLPHGIVVPTASAVNLVRFIESLRDEENAPKLAVGPCVCQKALDRWQEPSCKDIVVLYGAEIYLHLNLGYRIINADEAVAILERCRDAGLVHSLDFCMQSGQWHFVICNCDRDICVLVRVFQITGKMIYAGPLIVKQDKEHCLGPEACGHCVNICMFGANSIRDQAIHVDGRKCHGCGQCVRICRGKARELVRRARYAHENVIPAQVLLKGMAIGNEKQSGR